MKNLLFVLISFLFINASAADSTQVVNPEVKKVWLGLSAGINNPSALIGLSLDIKIHNHLGLFFGAGLGGWGTKSTIGLKYSKEFPFSNSFNLSFSTASGAELKNYQFENKTYNINVKRVNTLNLSYQPNFRLGKRARFSLEVGYSIALSNTQKAFSSDIAMPDNLSNSFKLLAPGGIMLGLGFTFGL